MAALQGDGARRAALERKVSAAFVSGMGAVRREVARRLEKHDDIHGRITGTPVAALLEPLEEALTELLADAVIAGVTAGARLEAKARREDWNDVDALAHEYAQTQSGVLIRNISASQHAAFKEVLAEAIRENLTIPEIAARTKNVVGLLPRDVRALAARRRRLRAAGTPPVKVEAQIAKAANAAVKRRATTIARTEAAAAIEQGKLQEWSLAIARGELPERVWRRWIAKDPCPVCRTLASLKPIPFGSHWIVKGDKLMRPPAHPNCKCSVALVFGV